MRSTQKRGPRTRAVKLMHAAHPASIESRLAAALAGTRTAATLNSMWSNAVVRAAGFREPPEAEPSPATNPVKPPPNSGGAQVAVDDPRPITLTHMPGGVVLIDVGTVALALTSTEFEIVKALCAPQPRRGSE